MGDLSSHRALRLALLAPLAWAVLASVAQAADPEGPGGDGLRAVAYAIPPEKAETLALQEGPEEKGLSVHLGSDLVTEYVSRGLVFSDEVSVQPWIELDAPLNAGDPVGPFSSLSAFAGNWNNFHDGAPDPALSRSNNRRPINDWYEADLYAGLRATLADRWAGSLRFNYYTSPSNDWQDITELDLRLHYDDGHWWSGPMAGFSLRPSLRIAKELRDRGGAENWFLRPQLEPTFTTRALGAPVTVTVPLVLGFGADGQYVTTDGAERHFGYFQTGVTASVPLELLPEKAGSLSLTGSLDYVVRSDDELSLDRDATSVVGRIGISYSY